MGNIIKSGPHQLGLGDVVEVRLSGVESNIYLVDDSNFGRLKRGESFHYGNSAHFGRSPIRLAAPSAGSWTAVVRPIRGRVTASFRLLRTKVGVLH
jgi:hypothetical protein